MPKKREVHRENLAVRAKSTTQFVVCKLRRTHDRQSGFLAWAVLGAVRVRSLSCSGGLLSLSW